MTYYWILSVLDRMGVLLSRLSSTGALWHRDFPVAIRIRLRDTWKWKMPPLLVRRRPTQWCSDRVCKQIIGAQYIGPSRAEVVQSVEGATNVTLLWMRCIYLQMSWGPSTYPRPRSKRPNMWIVVLCTSLTLEYQLGQVETYTSYSS